MRRRMRWVTVLAGACVVVAVLPAPSARAETFAVTRIDDPAPDGCAPRDCSLREAVIAANVTPETHDTILLPPGSFKLSVLGVTEDGSETGDLDIASPVSIRGAGRHATTIEGAMEDTVVHVLPAGDLSLSRVVMTGSSLGLRNDGAAALASSSISENLLGGILTTPGSRTRIIDSTVSGNSSFDGGGIKNNGGTVTITSSTVSGNTSDNGGGAIVNSNAGATIIRSSIISGNRAGTNEGGLGVRTGGGIENSTTSTLSIGSSIVSGNRAEDDGGAIRNRGTAHISGSTLFGNTSGGDGGGISNLGDTASLSITSSTISGNTATANGGGIADHFGGDATVVRSIVSGNAAELSGGGFAVLDSSTLDLSGSTVALNRAVTGGGIRALGGDAQVTLTDSTVSANTAQNSGGGLIFEGTATLLRTTVAVNQADILDGGTDGIGGGIAVASNGDLTLTASVVGNNDDGHGVQHEDCSGSITSRGANIVSVGAGCSGLNAQLGDRVNVNPGLRTLAYNGGPTPTHALTTTSPARDLLSSSLSTCAGTDQRGVPRPFGSSCDSGAYELAFCKGRIVNVVGTPGRDILTGTHGADGVLAFGGNDKIDTFGGDDCIKAGAGNDVVRSGAGADLVFGQDGNDVLIGQKGPDLLRAGAGDDILKGAAGADILKGQAADDILKGGPGPDALRGGAGTDVCKGGAGNDSIKGCE